MYSVIINSVDSVLLFMHTSMKVAQLVIYYVLMYYKCQIS